MRLLVSWAREFVGVSASPEAIADTLGLRGFEVASVERVGAPTDNDGVIDFEVTANRPDCLSVRGLAREIATAYNLPLRSYGPGANQPLHVSECRSGDNERLDVVIEDADGCPRYSAAVASVAERQVTTPSWMTDRLQASGVRTISPVVDITNYVLLELGQPMHAFDLTMLARSQIRVRRGRPAEPLTTLDKVTRALDADMLVIADAERAQAVAGVMGGAASEVTDSTRTVAFESACFKPASVRRTSKRLGLKTEASSRFERGTDIAAPILGLRRALALMATIGAGRAEGPIIDRYPAPRDPRIVHLRRGRLADLLGLTVPDVEVDRILRHLGLDVAPTTDGWDVTVPTFRVDVTREVDLIEEVGRHYGFEHVEARFPVMQAAAPVPDPTLARDDVVRHVLRGAGLSEAVTFGFIEAAAAEAFVTPEARKSIAALANPLSAKFDTLRPSILPGLVDAVAHNRRHGRRDVALFEIGARFSTTTGERRAVGVAITGLTSADHWSGTARAVDFFDMTGLVEAVCEPFGVPPVFSPVELPFLVRGQTAAIRFGREELGVVGLVAPDVIDGRGAPRQDKLYAAELDLDRLWTLRPVVDWYVHPLPRHPAIVRDLSVVVADTLPAAIIRGTILAAGQTLDIPLASVAFFDRFEGTGVGPGLVSVSVRLTFQALERTLTDAEVQRAFDTILAALVREHRAVQR